MTRTLAHLSESFDVETRAIQGGTSENTEVIEDFSHNDLAGNYVEHNKEEYPGLDDYLLTDERTVKPPLSLHRKENGSDKASPIYAKESNFDVPQPGDTFRYYAWIHDENANYTFRPYLRFGAYDWDSDQNHFYAVRPNFSSFFGITRAYQDGGSERELLAYQDITEERKGISRQWVEVTVDWRDSDDRRMEAWLRTLDGDEIAHIITDLDTETINSVQAYDTGTFGWTLYFDGTQDNKEIFSNYLHRIL